MLDLVVCSFPTIDPKLGASVTLPSFTEPNKVALRQEVEGFHVVNEA